MDLTGVRADLGLHKDTTGEGNSSEGPQRLKRRLESRGAAKFAEQSVHILSDLDFNSDRIDAEFVANTEERQIR